MVYERWMWQILKIVEDDLTLDETTTETEPRISYALEFWIVVLDSAVLAAIRTLRPQ